MPRTYERGETYDFAFSRVAMWNGELYFVLKDTKTGSETLPRYEELRWVFRVKALPFQRLQWNNGDEWSLFKCYVQGFMRDERGDTDFPQLVQDRDFVHEKLYGAADPDEPIPLTMTTQTRVADDGSIITTRRLLDANTGYCHDFPTEDLSGIPDGQRLEFYPARNKDGNIRLITESQHARNRDYEWRVKNIQTVVPVGTEIECKIVSIDDPKFISLENEAIKGFMKVPRPNSGDMPEIGEKVVFKCIGYTPTFWPKLQWTGRFAETINVDALPMLDLPQGGESKSVEYKSSLVYPADGNVPDIDKQLGQVIVRAVAAFMNADGGSIYIGVKDNGTVCGIENEGQFLMKDSEDNDTYPASCDGMQRKIINTLQRKIGDAAAAMAKVEFWQGPNSGHLVCEIRIQANEAEIPVYVDGSTLYVRNSGQNQRLSGPDEATFIVNRIRRLDEKRQNAASSTVADSAVKDSIQQQIAGILTTVATSTKKKRPALVLGKPVTVDKNTSVPLEEHYISALNGKFEGLVRDNRIVGKANTWSDLLVELLKELSTVDADKFEALPDEPSFVGRGNRPIFARKGARTHLRDASGYLGSNGDIRVDRKDGTKGAFLVDPKTKKPGLALRLIEHFGLKPEQFRIWTGKQ